MSWPLLLVVAAVTVGSRVLPMTLLPAPRGRLAQVLDALPPPLFAALAAHSLVGAGTLPSASALVASAAALVASTRRSLGLTLAGGVAGFVVASAVLG